MKVIEMLDLIVRINAQQPVPPVKDWETYVCLRSWVRSNRPTLLKIISNIHEEGIDNYVGSHVKLNKEIDKLKLRIETLQENHSLQMKRKTEEVENLTFRLQMVKEMRAEMIHEFVETVGTNRDPTQFLYKTEKKEKENGRKKEEGREKG